VTTAGFRPELATSQVVPFADAVPTLGKATGKLVFSADG
jgi:hypothetical protein